MEISILSLQINYALKLLGFDHISHDHTGQIEGLEEKLKIPKNLLTIISLLSSLPTTLRKINPVLGLKIASIKQFSIECYLTPVALRLLLSCSGQGES